MRRHDLPQTLVVAEVDRVDDIVAVAVKEPPRLVEVKRLGHAVIARLQPECARGERI